MKHEVGDSVESIAEMIELGTDLMWRYLIDRDDLSASAALVVNRLYREGPKRLTALAEAEGASQTQLVQRLERQGLLEKRSDPKDGRASLVALGEAGMRNWHSRAGVRRERIARLLPGVSHDDEVALWLAAQVVIRVLGQMHQSAESFDRHAADARG